MAIRLAVVGAVILSAVLIYGATQDIRHDTRGQTYATQEAHDAVQDQRIASVENMQVAQSQVVTEISDKLTYLLGGVAGFGALFVFIRAFEIRRKP